MNGHVLVGGAGMIAGMMNALAGGGTFVTLPALIAAGLPSVQANTSSTVALFPAGLVSAWSYRDGLGPIGAISMRTLTLTTVVGGTLGAVLLLRTPTRIFDSLLPWLLSIATAALAFAPQLGDWLRRRWQIRPATMLTIQFLLGIYGGYFGGGIGLMMLAVWSVLDNRSLKSLNAHRTVMVSSANATAVLIFIAARAVRWEATLVMLAGAAIGGLCGAQIGRRAPPRAVRIGTVGVSTAITLAFFVRTYA